MKNLPEIIENGFVTSPKRLGYVTDNMPPREDEIEICKEWLRKWAKPRKTMNNDRSSYEIKHFIEHTDNKYVTNGAFIQAAIEEGYKVERIEDSPNAIFNIDVNAYLKTRNK